MITPGFFELYSAARPALPAGRYSATSHHELRATPPHGGPVDVPVDDTQFHLDITAPRFVMPPDQILSTFPPAGFQGDWRERMPQIVLKRRTLPWERNPTNPPTDPTVAPSWLALVVLADGEGQLSSEVDVTQCVTAGVDLGPDADVPTGKYLEVSQDIIDKVFPCLDELELLCHVRHVSLDDTELALGDDDGFLAVVMSSRLPQPGPVDAANPDGTPLRYTAYLVNVEHQLDRLLVTEPDPLPYFEFADVSSLVNPVLLAPPPNATLDQIAMNIGPGLRTTELAKGLAPAVNPPGAAAPYGVARGLETAAGAWATGPVKSQPKTSGELEVIGGLRAGINSGLLQQISMHYRFPVLVSWEFTCTADGGFERLMNDLDVGLLGTIDAAQPKPVPEVAPTGHVALDHRTRRGDSARSWYRGPLVPQPTQRLEPVDDGSLDLAQVADQLRRVGPDGREDVSLAALFEIGRLLTLSKPTLVAALMQWRAELFGAARARELANALTASVLSNIGLAAAGGRESLEALLRTSLVGAFVTATATAPSGAPPPGPLAVAAQERTAARVPVALNDMASSDVLVGLGTTRAAITRAIKQSGVDGLAGIVVPVGQVSTAPLSQDELARQAVTAHLTERLTTLAASVLKTDGPAPTPKGTRRSAATSAPPPRDSLDQLIRDASRKRS